MKVSLTIDLAPLKKEAEDSVYTLFADGNSLLLLEHAQKRLQALGAQQGFGWTKEFAQAAQIENMQPMQFAECILSKSDSLLEHGNKRRQAILAVRRASSIAELDSILDGLGIPRRGTNG